MPKTARTTARQRAEQARLVRERAARRERRIRTAWWAIAVAPALVLVLVIVKAAMSAPSGPSDNTPAEALAPNVVAALSPVASSLDTVGKGDGVTFPTRTQDQTLLTSADKPLVLYVGAEYCPFCASQRWALVIALNRFGTFAGLTATHSGSAPEVYPDTATLSFHGAAYASEYITFQGVELADRAGKTLETMTPEQEQVLRTYDTQGSVPFVSFGNQFVQTGASYSPETINGLSHDEIALKISDDPSGDVARAVLGAANAFTAIICQLTGGEPGEVCDSPAVAAYQQEVGGA